LSYSPHIYRAYCFDHARKSVSVEEIDAGTDEEAIAAAEAAGFGSQCEVWQGRRLVAQLEGARREA
jgi:hypothetical protein